MDGRVTRIESSGEWRAEDESDKIAGFGGVLTENGTLGVIHG